MKDCLLIDADILIYKAAAKHQTEIYWDEDEEPQIETDYNEAKDAVINFVELLEETYSSPDIIMCLSSETNWRKLVLPTYKENRKNVRRPKLLPQLRAYLEAAYECKSKPDLEADDVMGILSTKADYMPDHRKIIVSQDKDMKTIPGWLYNPDKPEEPARLIDEDEADYHHLWQTLVGDSTDGYKGCPRIGKVKATKALDEDCSWDTVMTLYSNAGLTEEDALIQARVARICRATDYDFKKQEVVLWEA